LLGDDEIDDLSPLNKALRLQDGLVARATGGEFGGGEAAYKELRMYFRGREDTKDKLPDFVKRYVDTTQFWAWVKYEKSTYHDRRSLIWEAFRPLVEFLEFGTSNPSIEPISILLAKFNQETVHSDWQKALSRKASDPEGAITAARALVESVCKHILDECDVKYKESIELPKLWAIVAEQLKLLPTQYDEEIFRSILGNCQSIVGNIAAIRNRIGDSHGKGKRPVRPKPRHAELTVNLAGAMASFLVSTWNEREN
jgi:hypothetical protein